MIQEQICVSSLKEKYQNQPCIQEILPEIEIISASGSTRKHLYQDNQQQNDNEEILDINTIQLTQGNPILPPGKHNIKEQPNFRLKFLSNRQKFNKTSFMMPSLGNSMMLTSRKIELQTNKKSINKNKIIEEEQQQDIQYVNLLKNKKQIYRRIKNSKLNKIGKDKIICSIFFDSRKQKIISKTIPIYQHIAKIRNIKPVQIVGDWLQFQSSFESGNLLMVFKLPTDHLITYQLYMQNDINTKGCTQWFYFKVINYSRGKAKFRIMNFYKPSSLYQKGMKILYSHDGIQWKRTGTSIKYFKNQQHQGYYTLDFIYQFEANSKTTYFSYGYPYTYSTHLSHFISNFNSDPKYQKMLTKGTLCLSAMNNPIPILYITNQNNKKQPKQQKQIIYIIGRQHPGETPSSYIMEGLIVFLISNTQEAKDLRDKYQFRIIPMVNVDGVISGNYRSNISGFDINRQWQFPSKRVLPEVFWLKQQVASNKRNVAFFLDIHAHSRKMNSFFYGSNKPNKENKLFPFVCSKLNKFISYNQSTFNDDPSKKSTARVILQSQLSIEKSLTFEVSFYGYYDDIKQSNYSFKQNDLRNIGECLGVGFYYSMIGIQNIKKTQQNKILPKHMNQKQKALQKNSVKILQKWQKQLQKQAKQNNEDAFSQGSSIDPEHFQLKQQQKIMLNEAIQRQLKLQSDKGIDGQSKDTSKRKQIIFSSLQPQDSKLLNPKGETSNDGSLIMSGTQFYEISTAKPKIQPKTLFSVRQLQLELQGNAQIYPQRKIRGLRLKMGQKNVGVVETNKRYGSLDLDIDSRKNYRNDVIEMKKALKYLLQSKTSNYEDYKSCFRSFNTEISYMTKNQFKVNKK